jgi:hypothetical protein
MKSVMTERMSETVRADSPPLNIEQECETWDWARAAGVSAQDLRRALLDWLRGGTAA